MLEQSTSLALFRTLTVHACVLPAVPGDLVRQSYTLEYGSATIEVGRDTVAPGTAVILVDDLLATGGTAKAGAELMASLGAAVLGLLVIVELVDLPGADVFGLPVRSILQI